MAMPPSFGVAQGTPTTATEDNPVVFCGRFWPVLGSGDEVEHHRRHRGDAGADAEDDRRRLESVALIDEILVVRAGRLA